LQFDVRAALRTDLTGHQGLAERQGVVDGRTLELAGSLIGETFNPSVAAAPLSEVRSNRAKLKNWQCRYCR